MCPVSLSPLSSCLTACAQATLLASSYIHPTHHTLTIVLVNAASTDESVTVVVPTPSVELFQTAVSSDNHLWQVSLYLYTYIYLCVCVCVCVCVLSAMVRSLRPVTWQESSAAVVDGKATIVVPGYGVATLIGGPIGDHKFPTK